MYVFLCIPLTSMPSPTIFNAMRVLPDAHHAKNVAWLKIKTQNMMKLIIDSLISNHVIWKNKLTELVVILKNIGFVCNCFKRASSMVKLSFTFRILQQLPSFGDCWKKNISVQKKSGFPIELTKVFQTNDFSWLFNKKRIFIATRLKSFSINIVHLRAGHWQDVYYWKSEMHKVILMITSPEYPQ